MEPNLDWKSARYHKNFGEVYINLQCLEHEGEIKEVSRSMMLN